MISVRREFALLFLVFSCAWRFFVRRLFNFRSAPPTAAAAGRRRCQVMIIRQQQRWPLSLRVLLGRASACVVSIGGGATARSYLACAADFASFVVVVVVVAIGLHRQPGAGFAGAARRIAKAQIGY